MRSKANRKRRRREEARKAAINKRPRTDCLILAEDRGLPVTFGSGKEAAASDPRAGSGRPVPMPVSFLAYAGGIMFAAIKRGGEKRK